MSGEGPGRRPAIVARVPWSLRFPDLDAMFRLKKIDVLNSVRDATDFGVFAKTQIDQVQTHAQKQEANRLRRKAAGPAERQVEQPLNQLESQARPRQIRKGILVVGDFRVDDGLGFGQ